MDMQGDSLQTQEAVDIEAFIADHKLGAVADVQIEAHGDIYTVREAITKCPPFADMVVALTTTLEGIPDAQKRVEKTIKSMATTTTVLSVEAKKK